MRVPVEWLKELVDFSLSPEELSLKLTMVGLEVEAVEKMWDDTVLEVNVTPNRPDCLSMLGIAREVSALLNIPLKFPDYRIKEETGAATITVEIVDEDLCRRYAGRDIRGVIIGDSPEWMRKRLEKCGMRPINNVVDITNYVLLEMGHPLHAFDMDTLKGRKIRVARNHPGGKITTLDGTERLLPGEALLIWDGERPVAVAGVMGGADTEVKEKTKNIFLESAYFLPSSIRRTSKALGLKTESAYRFERGTDIELLEKALDRAASLMAVLVAGKVSKRVDVYPGPFQPTQITVRYERVDRILGIPIAHDEVVAIAERLGLAVTKSSTFFTATPPSFRGDLQREIDVIEEIARFYGYDRIPVTVPRIQISREPKDTRHHYIQTVKDSFRGAGFSEAINYSFMNYQVLDMLNIGEGDTRRKTLTLRNPLNEEESHLRTAIIPSLIQNLVHNMSMGSRDLRLFEVSRIFIDRGEALPEEEHHLGAIYFREKGPSLWKNETPDFFIVKGVIQSLLDSLRIDDHAFQPSLEPFLHPGKSADILVSGRRIGFLGTLHPDVVEKLSLKVSQPEILVTEMNLDALLSSVPEIVKYVPIPRYPHIDRDIALIVDESLPASGIMEQMRAYPSELIEDISIFDFYKGKNIPGGKKSLAFTIRYRAKDRTLTDFEIEELHGKIIRYITEKTGGTVRGT
jgi:phenylalanyl-tRNA synthetase beta chain